MPSWSDGETSSEGLLSAEYPEGGFIPGTIEDPTWCGIAVGSTYRCCVHNELPEKLVAYQGRNTGRRFLACAVENEVENCGFVEWIDEEWPESLQYALHTLWSKVDELTVLRLEEQLDKCVVSENLAEMEKKYSDLKAEVNKMVDDTVKKVQLANYYANLKEKDKDETKCGECDKARTEAEAKVAEMVEENNKLELEKKALKEEKKKLEYALFDLLKAHHVNKDKLKGIKEILDGSNAK